MSELKGKPATIKECFEAVGSRFPFLVEYSESEYLITHKSDRGWENINIAYDSPEFFTEWTNTKVILLDYFEPDYLEPEGIGGMSIPLNISNLVIPECNCKRKDFQHNEIKNGDDNDCGYKKYKDSNRITLEGYYE